MSQHVSNLCCLGDFPSQSRPLGTNSLLAYTQFSVSTSEDGLGGGSAALYGRNAWCAISEDVEPFLQVRSLCTVNLKIEVVYVSRVK